MVLPTRGLEAAPVVCPANLLPCCHFETARARESGELRLGFHLWPLDARSFLSHAAELRPGIVRFSVGPFWPDLPAIDVAADLDEVRRYVWEAISPHAEKWRDAAMAQRRLAGAANQVDELLIIWQPPLTNLDSVELRRRGSRRTIQREAIVVFARFYIALIESARRLGFRIDLVEIANEPDGAWNMHIPLEHYVELLEALRKESADAKVALPRIAGPGLAFLRSMASYLSDRELAGRMLRLLDVVSVHAWDDRVGNDILDEARAVRRLLDGLGWRSPILVSEFAPTYPTPEDRSAKRGPDQRGRTQSGDPLVSELPRYAPATVELALALSALGFNPLVYWEFQDPAWGSVSYGLLDTVGRPRPAYGSWAQVSQFLATHRIDLAVPEAHLGERIFGLFQGQRLAGMAILNKERGAYAIQLSETSIAPRAAGSTGQSGGEQARYCAPPGGGAGVVIQGDSTLIVGADR